MARVSYLFRRGATYYARIDVPKDLIEVAQTSTWKKSLKTKDEAEAKRRLPAIVANWHSEFDDLRARSILTPADREHAVWDHYTTTLDRDDTERLSHPTSDSIEAEKAAIMARAERGEIANDPLAILDATLDLKVMQEWAAFSSEVRKTKLAELRKHLVKGETALIAHEVDEYLRVNKLFAAPGSPGWISIARAMMRAEIEALQRTMERDGGDYTGQPADPIVKPANHKRREVARPGETIMEVFEIFASENPRGVAKDRVDQCRRDISTFVQLVGASFPISKIGKPEVRDWKQLLVKYPIKATETKAFAGMNIQQIVKANEQIGKPVIADRTVNRYLSSLSAFLSWAENNGYMERNPVDGLMLKKESKAPTLTFKTEQLNALFNSPWFVGCASADKWRNVAKPGDVLIRDHRFWVPLIMLFSGARPGEIGQLAVNDVRQEQGHWIMHITTEGDDTKEGKSVKTAGSMRVVPVHSELIRLGFVDYHAKRVKEGGAQLFPGAKRNARGQMLADLSREFGRYMTKIGLKKGRGLSLYSFRHGAADALRRAGYLDNEFGFILGHTEASMTGRYGHLPQGLLEKRVELIESISFPGFDLAHLLPRGAI